MSFSTGYNTKAALEADSRSYSSPDPIAEGQGADMVEAGRKAALELIQSGVVGTGEDKDFMVSISGHANPGHEPTPGWANDCLTVSITQITPPPPEAAG